jgi:phosphatidate cytidylyltransferase
MEDQNPSDSEKPGDESPPEPTEVMARPGRPRIEGVEAGVAAGLVPPPEPTEPIGPRHLAPGQSLFEQAVPEEIIEGVELPDWTDPPTREVPRVLLSPDSPQGPAIPEPVWRESQSDFDQDQEAFAEMVSGSVPVVAHDEAGEEDELSYEAVPQAAVMGPPRPAAREEPLDSFPHTAPGRGFVQDREPRKQRSAAVATATGLVIGAIALVCFWAGPPAVLAIACVMLVLAAAEFFQALRRAHYQPATLLGLVAAPGFAVATYLKGPVAVPLVMAVAVIATIGWYLVGITRKDVVANAAGTFLGIGWVAVLGSFAGLLLDPSAFPSRHGLAFLLGALEATVAYDVGGYAVGSLLGKHKLAPSLSPNKTWEGLVGGSLCALVVALAITSQMAPWDLGRAAALGIVVAVIAPIGDLAESMIKRDLRVKDMGSLLPAHGGVLDRLDAMLFVLPATYFLVRLFHG